MFPPLFLVLFLALAHFHTSIGLNYHFEPNCVPACTSNSDPLVDNLPCMCRPDANPTGCQLAPCGPGDDSSGTYTCQCTEYFQPVDCVTLSCDNGTNSYGTTCPYPSYSSSYYPSQSYPTPSYTPTYNPSQSYPTQSYPPSYNPPQSYPTPSYQPPQYGYSQPSYSPYPSYNLCNNYCVCEPYLPADCTDDSIPPIIGGPACACNPDSWPTGCTFKPCQSTDTGDDNYFCECTAENSPWFCYLPRCTPS